MPGRTNVRTSARVSAGSVRSACGEGSEQYVMTMRTAHSAAREACSGSSQRAKNGAARSLETSITWSKPPKVT